MVNNTVNGKKIGTPAGKDDNTKLAVSAVGKRSRESGLDSNGNAEISIINFFDKNTKNYKAIKAYPGGRNKEEIIH